MDENTENVGGRETEGTEKPKQAGAQPAEKPTQISKDVRNWAMLCHLLGLFTSFVGPLIIWLIKKEEDAFIDTNGREALNFQITVAIALVVSAVLSVVCVGLILGLAVAIVDLVFCVIASVKTSSGEAYRYPVCIRFVK